MPARATLCFAKSELVYVYEIFRVLLAGGNSLDLILYEMRHTTADNEGIAKKWCSFCRRLTTARWLGGAVSRHTVVRCVGFSLNASLRQLQRQTSTKVTFAGICDP